MHYCSNVSVKSDSEDIYMTKRQYLTKKKAFIIRWDSLVVQSLFSVKC